MSSKKLYKFWKPQCPPCNTVKAILEKIIDQFPNIELIEVNVQEEKNKWMLAQFNITSVPVLMFESGEKFIGASNQATITNFIRKNSEEE